MYTSVSKKLCNYRAIVELYFLLNAGLKRVDVLRLRELSTGVLTDNNYYIEFAARLEKTFFYLAHIIFYFSKEKERKRETHMYMRTMLSFVSQRVCGVCKVAAEPRFLHYIKLGRVSGLLSIRAVNGIQSHMLPVNLMHSPFTGMS